MPVGTRSRSICCDRCWDRNQTLTEEAILLGSRKGHRVYQAIEIVCKGPEVTLPDECFLPGQGRKESTRSPGAVVAAAGQDLPRRCHRAAGNEDRIPNVPLPAEWKGRPYSGRRYLFGHYWFSGQPAVISPQFACVDYQCRQGGPLLAYRFDGESVLASERWRGYRCVDGVADRDSPTVHQLETIKMQFAVCGPMARPIAHSFRTAQHRFTISPMIRPRAEPRQRARGQLRGVS